MLNILSLFKRAILRARAFFKKPHPVPALTSEERSRALNEELDRTADAINAIRERLSNG